MQVILGLVFLVGLVWSGQGVWTWMTNWSPEKMTCQEYLAQGAEVDAVWVELEGCYVDHLETTAVFEGSRVTMNSSFYIPLMGPESGGERRPMGFYLVADETQKRLLYEAFVAQREHDDLTAYWEQNPAVRDMVFYQGQEDIVGLRIRGVDLDEEDKKLLSDDVGSGNFTVVEKDAPLITLTRFLVFVVCGGLLLFGISAAAKEDDEAELQQGE